MSEQLTLLELNLLIRNSLQDTFPDSLWLVAEISDLKENRSGHCYLELIDKNEATNEIEAKARATIWSYSWRMIRPYFEHTTGKPLQPGIRVLLNASIEFHPSYGLSLNIKDIDPNYTLGDLAHQRREIMRRLESAGVIDMNRELPLPMVPQNIAIISSATAAGYEDFVHQLENNRHRIIFHTELFEAFMQGRDSTPSILAALDMIYSREEEFDAVAIIRGGGATTDLSSFDSFELAYAVAQFPLPVITGIGHEKDETILDRVAHTRMKTPTAAAEFFIAGIHNFIELLAQRSRQLNQITQLQLQGNLSLLSRMAFLLENRAKNSLISASQQLTKAGRLMQRSVAGYQHRHSSILQRKSHRLGSATRNYALYLLGKLSKAGMALAYATKNYKDMSAISILEKRLRNSLGRHFENMEMQLTQLSEKQRMLDPENILKRGYTITLQEGKIVTSATQIIVKNPLVTHFKDGKTVSKITNTETYGNDEETDLSRSSD